MKRMLFFVALLIAGCGVLDMLPKVLVTYTMDDRDTEVAEFAIEAIEATKTYTVYPGYPVQDQQEFVCNNSYYRNNQRADRVQLNVRVRSHDLRTFSTQAYFFHLKINDIIFDGTKIIVRAPRSYKAGVAVYDTLVVSYGDSLKLSE